MSTYSSLLDRLHQPPEQHLNTLVCKKYTHARSSVSTKLGFNAQLSALLLYPRSRTPGFPAGRFGLTEQTGSHQTKIVTRGCDWSPECVHQFLTEVRCGVFLVFLFFMLTLGDGHWVINVAILITFNETQVKILRQH